MHRETRTPLKVDDAELRSRRAYFEITDEDLERLASLRGFGQQHLDDVIEAFYRFILEQPDSRVFFVDDTTVQRVKRLQKEYFLGLFSGVLDLKYVENRLRVGATHERIGMPLRTYLGAYALYLRLLLVKLGEDHEPALASLYFRSIQKLVYFDMSLAVDTYIASYVETLGRHQAAIRELSTPCIRVYDRILLLPLVGTIDTQRAQQIMETVLVRVADEQAKVVIVDIAGVPVVDTKVADHLLKTTAALRLIGAESILTGISPHVARTIVQLGVDITSMHTKSRLADGIELALTMCGKRIASVTP
jgi:rsbT co-antagonist protein RsbR